MELRKKYAAKIVCQEQKNLNHSKIFMTTRFLALPKNFVFSIFS